MEDYKKKFIDFMLSCGVLKFGSFTLKSGRNSPFFMNAGSYVTGGQLLHLGEFYAKGAYEYFGDRIDVFFGPAYKGIPLAVSTSIAYKNLFGIDVRYCSNRKEEKDHGADKGLFLGGILQDGDRIVIVEDVATSGKSIDEVVPLIKNCANVEIIGEIVSLDRQEKAYDSNKSALEHIEEKYGFPVRSIVTMREIVDSLKGSVITDEIFLQIEDYYRKWGSMF